MFGDALPGVLEAPDDLAKRLQCQLAAWLSISGSNSGVRVGASHALGHALGAHANIAHGLTSCVLLPSVMKWNQPANAERQRLVNRVMGHPKSDASDSIASFIRGLGLPTRLQEVGVKQHDLEAIAKKSLRDPLMRHNPRIVESYRDVLEILNMAW
jgi:maleylacetate reductase